MSRRHRTLLLLCLLASAAAQEDPLREAARLDSEGKCAEAETYYRKALAQTGATPALLNNFGNHFVACGQPAQARVWFERLLKLNPAHTNANLQLARIEAGQKNGARALQYLARVTDTGPAVLLLKAEASHWAGKDADAQALLDTVEKEAASDPRVLFQLGLACARIGLYARAESTFNTVLAQYPADLEVLFNLGRAAARAGHLERAARALESALKIDPANADTLLELGLLHTARQDFSRAVYVLAQASQRAPSRADILLALARAAGSAGYYGDAVAAYDRYLKLQPNDDAAHRDRALALGLGGSNLPAALRELELYVHRHPADPVGHYNLAQLYWRSSPTKALDNLSAAIKADSNFAGARFARAWLLFRLGRAAESLPDLEIAQKADPANPRVLSQTGLVYLSTNRPADAEAVLRRALEIAPQDPEALLRLGRALTALDRDDDARAVLEQYRRQRRPAPRGPRTESGMIELATLPEAERNRREIERLRLDARSRPGDHELQLSLAALLLADGRIDEAKTEFRELATRNADRTLWEKAGAALLASEQFELAREFLQRAVDAGGPPSVRLDLALAVFFTGGAQPALHIVDEIPDGQRNGDCLLLKARLLDAAGRAAEAEQALDRGLHLPPSTPQAAQQTARLLLRHNRSTEALAFLAQSTRTFPDESDLLLLRAAALGLHATAAEAEKEIRTIESKWPEWDQPYLVHGLLLEQTSHNSEALQKIRTAIALGASQAAARCALSRLTGSSSAGDPQCRCAAGLNGWLFPSCREVRQTDVK